MPVTDRGSLALQLTRRDDLASTRRLRAFCALLAYGRVVRAIRTYWFVTFRAAQIRDAVAVSITDRFGGRWWIGIGRLIGIHAVKCTCGRCVVADTDTRQRHRAIAGVVAPGRVHQRAIWVRVGSSSVP